MNHHGYASMIVVTKPAAQASGVKWLSRNVFWQTYDIVCRKISLKTIVGMLLQNPGRQCAVYAVSTTKALEYQCHSVLRHRSANQKRLVQSIQTLTHVQLYPDMSSPTKPNRQSTSETSHICFRISAYCIAVNNSAKITKNWLV